MLSFFHLQLSDIRNFRLDDIKEGFPLALDIGTSGFGWWKPQVFMTTGNSKLATFGLQVRARDTSIKPYVQTMHFKVKVALGGFENWSNWIFAKSCSIAI